MEPARHRHVAALTPFLVAAAAFAGGGEPARWTPDMVVRDPAFAKIDGVCLCGGNLYVTDKGDPRLFAFDADGRRLFKLPARDGHGPFEKPIGITCAAGRVVVVDTGRACVFVLDLGGHIERQIEGPREALFIKPEGAAPRPDGSFYVVDTGSHMVTLFDPAGHFLRAMGGKGSGPGQLFKPESAAVALDGRVYVADEGNFRVSVFDADGRFVSEVGSRGDGPGRFAGDVEGVAVDGRGLLLALDSEEGVLEVFDDGGRFVTRIGNGIGDGTGQLLSPDGIFYDAERDALWVADQGHRQVLRFPLGALLSPHRARP